MIVIGITGSVGTGKTTVARMFARHRVAVIDADKISHQLMQQTGACARAVIRQFGTAAVVTSGKIDRKKLAGIVFHDPRMLKKLCAIMHPAIIKEIKRQCARYRRQKKYAVIIDAPLLFETGLERMMDIVIVVKANQKKQIERMSKRMAVRPYAVIARMRSQMPLQEKIRLADIIIDNRGSRTQTRQQVAAVWKKIRTLADAHRRRPR